MHKAIVAKFNINVLHICNMGVKALHEQVSWSGTELLNAQYVFKVQYIQIISTS